MKLLPYLKNSKYFYTVAITAILVFAALPRFYNLSYCNLLHDSSASLEASLSISKNNVPLLPCGDVWYARSPLYHYFLGYCIKFLPFFEPRMIGRFITALFNLICCLEIYLLGKAMGNKNAGLIGALIAAVNPFFIFMSRIIRFYSVATAMGLLAIICFYRGYVTDEKNTKCQILTFIFLIVAFLTGEVTSTAIPGTALGYLLLGQKPDKKTLYILIAGTLCFLCVVVGDMKYYYARGRTPFIAMHYSTSPQIVPHLTELFDNMSFFFIGSYQSNVVISFFLLIGMVQAFVSKNKNFLLMFLILFVTVLLVQLLVLLTSERYFFHIFPMAYIGAGFGIEKSIKAVLNYLKQFYSKNFIFSPICWIVLFGMTIFPIGLCVITDINPARMFNSYFIHLVLNARTEDAVRFVKSHKIKGDVLVTSMGEIATVYDVKVDYYPWRLCYFDEVFYKEGKLIERHSGAVAVGDTDKFRQILRRHKRVWIVYMVNRGFDEELMKFIKYNFPLKAVFGSVFVGLWDSRSADYQHIKPVGYDRCYF